MLLAVKFNKEGYCIEQQSIQCRKTKTGTRNKGHRQSNEPIKTRSKYMQTTKSAGKRVRPSHDCFGFISDWMKK